jgi:hypothetical protein
LSRHKSLRPSSDYVFLSVRFLPMAAISWRARYPYSVMILALVACWRGVGLDCLSLPEGRQVEFIDLLEIQFGHTVGTGWAQRSKTDRQKKRQASK